MIIMLANKSFKFLVICMIALLFAGCDYLFGNKSLNFQTVYVGVNGPDIGRGSYYKMKDLYALTDAEAVENSWLNAVMTRFELEKLVKETDFTKKFLLLYLSYPLRITNPIEISSVSYSNDKGHINLDLTLYSKSYSQNSIADESLTYPFIIAAVDKPKERYVDFEGGRGIFTQSSSRKAEKLQSGIARAFDEVKMYGAKLVPMEQLQLELEHCFEERKQGLNFCDDNNIKYRQKNIELAITHFDESTPTLEGIIKENLQICLEMKQKYGHVCDELRFSVSISNAVKTRQELLNRRRKE